MKWGILGTGAIARLFAAALQHDAAGSLVAVASRTGAASDISEFAGSRRYGSYEGLLADREVEAVYIATPHVTHAEWAVKAAEAGKHVLCEKPIAMNAAEADRMFRTAERCGVVLMEAFMYRTHPQTAKLVELIASDVIGKVGLVQIEIGFGRPFDPKHRLYDPMLGGGAILDIGCYAMSMARLVGGAASGRPFANVTRMQGSVRRAPNGVDQQAYAVAELEGDVTAVISAPLNLLQTAGVRIHGEQGEIHIPSPWLCTGRTGGRSVISVKPRGKDQQEIVFETPQWLYAIEARAFAEAVQSGVITPPVPDSADTLSNMRALDMWRKVTGLVFPQEIAHLPFPLDQ